MHKNISPQEANKFAEYSRRLPEVQRRIVALKNKEVLLPEESDELETLRTELKSIFDWFDQTKR